MPSSVYLKSTRRAVLKKSQTRFAVLGNGAGQIYPANQLGMAYVRFPESVDSNGYSIYSAPVLVRVASNSNHASYEGAGVRVGWQDGSLTILRGDFETNVASGVDPRFLNPNLQERQFINLNNVSRLMARPIGNADTSSYLVTVFPAFYQDGQGNVQYFAGEKFNLSPYIPSTASHHLVCMLWLSTYTNSIVATVSTSQANTTPLDFTDYSEAYLAGYDDDIPIQGFHLNTGQTSVTLQDLGLDARQFIHIPSRYGFMNTVNRPIRIATNREQITTELTVNSSVDVDGQIVVFDANSTSYLNGTQYNLTTKTANYSAALNDNVILCDGTFTLTLPDATMNLNHVYNLKNIGSGVITVIASSGNIDGLTSKLLSAKSNMHVISDGTDYYIL